LGESVDGGPPNRSHLNTTLRHRFGKVSITVLTADGQPLDDRMVFVEQRVCAFSLGKNRLRLHPFALTARHGKRNVLEVGLQCPTYEIE
jgi:hypothetical protein